MIFLQHVKFPHAHGGSSADSIESIRLPAILPRFTSGNLVFTSGNLVFTSLHLFCSILDDQCINTAISWPFPAILFLLLANLCQFAIIFAPSGNFCLLQASSWPLLAIFFRVLEFCVTSGHLFYHLRQSYSFPIYMTNPRAFGFWVLTEASSNLRPRFMDFC
jgi:hypothetical protein